MAATWLNGFQPKGAKHEIDNFVDGVALRHTGTGARQAVLRTSGVLLRL
jgi:hypothetical protein